MDIEKKWGLPVTAKDDGLHSSDSQEWWEWWYFDGDFNNGYTMAGTLHFGSPRFPPNPEARFIELSIYDPSGEKTWVRKRIPIEQCFASTEGLDVVMGPNTYKGNYERTHLHIEANGTGVDLNYEAMVEPYKSDDMLWVVGHARAKVSGTLTIDGKKIEVKGEGYHDHNWGDKLLGGEGDFFDAFWPRIYVGDWTVNLAGGRRQRKEGYNPYCTVQCWNKDKLMAATNKGGGIGSDPQVYQSGTQYPGKYRLYYECPGVVEGEVNFNVKQVIEFMDLFSRFNPFQKWYASIFVGQQAYFRFRLDFDMNLKIAGQDVRQIGQCWAEYHKFV